MRHWQLIVLIAAAILSGCRQQAAPVADVSDLNVELQVTPEDPTVGEAELLVTVTDGEGNPIDDATVSVRGDMSHAGMVPVLGDVEGGENGVYSIPFEWTMAGDWTVEVTVELADGTTANQTFPFSVTGGEMDMDDMEDGEMEMTEEAASESD